jgi:hypothetical protein
MPTTIVVGNFTPPPAMSFHFILTSLSHKHIKHQAQASSEQVKQYKITPPLSYPSPNTQSTTPSETDGYRNTPNSKIKKSAHKQSTICIVNTPVNTSSENTDGDMGMVLPSTPETHTGMISVGII